MEPTSIDREDRIGDGHERLNDQGTAWAPFHQKPSTEITRIDTTVQGHLATGHGDDATPLEALGDQHDAARGKVPDGVPNLEAPHTL